MNAGISALALDAVASPKDGLATESQTVREADERFHDEKGASAYLKTRGINVAPTTLRKLRSVGGGPGFIKSFGGRIVYPQKSGLDAWAEQQRSPLVTSTSQLSPSAA